MKGSTISLISRYFKVLKDFVAKNSKPPYTKGRKQLKVIQCNEIRLIFREESNKSNALFECLKYYEIQSIFQLQCLVVKPID